MAIGSLVEPNDLTEAGEGIYYSQNRLPMLDQRVIHFLKNIARSTPRRRSRFCAHPSPDAEQHDMVIVSHRDTYIPPHRHLFKTETFVVIEGFVDILLFSEQGEVASIVKMGPAASGRPFFYRMPPRQFHSLAVETELLVFLESTKGPFRSDDCENAPWAPPPAAAEGKAFIAASLRRGLANAAG